MKITMRCACGKEEDVTSQVAADLLLLCDKWSDDANKAEQQLAAARAEVAEARRAVEAIMPFVEEDFPDGVDGECCATPGYRLAYRKLQSILEVDNATH